MSELDKLQKKYDALRVAIRQARLLIKLENYEAARKVLEMAQKMGDE